MLSMVDGQMLPNYCINSKKVIIHFPNSPARRVNLYGDKARLTRQLCLGSIDTVVNTLIGSSEWKDVLFDKVANGITRELTGLCALSQPSLLRQKAKEDLVTLKWNDIYN
ncbi:hypothetical protein ACROYT_G014782 [Oculina patagonica]